MTESRGVLYIATGERYVDDARTSAISVKQHNPDLPIAIVTTADIILDEDLELFDHVIRADVVNDNVSDKLYNLHLTPFQRTLYLDNDTIILGQIRSVFNVLNRYELGLVQKGNLVSIRNIPDAFREPNLGVVLFEITDSFRSLLNGWIANYENQLKWKGWVIDDLRESKSEFVELSAFGIYHDQPAFRKALYESKIYWTPLPDEWNWKSNGVVAIEEVKILHFGGSVPNKIRKKMRANVNKYPNNLRIKWYSKIIVKNKPDILIYPFDYILYITIMNMMNKLRVPFILDVMNLRNKSSNIKNNLVKWKWD